MTDLFFYRTRVEIERHRRIMVSIWAYAYEFDNETLVSDHHFDAECLKVDRSINTGHPIMDAFFANEEDFHPCTGQWITWHPELEKIANLYYRYFKGKHDGNRRSEIRRPSEICERPAENWTH